MTKSRTIQRIKLALGLAGVLSSINLATATTASAGTGDIYDSWISSNSGGAHMRTCASTACTSITYLGNGTHLYMLCWWDGQTATGNYTSNRWFRVGLYYDNRSGFVHSSLVAHQNPNSPRCSSGSI